MNVIDRLNIRRIRRRFSPLMSRNDEEVRDLFVRARAETKPADTKALLAILVGSLSVVIAANAGLLGGVSAILDDLPSVVHLLLWLAIAGGGFMLLVWWNIRWERRIVWRMTQFLCSACGYDLTGNTSGRCPECGRAVEPSADAPGATASPEGEAVRDDGMA